MTYTYFKLVNNAYEPTRQTEELQGLEGDEIRIELQSMTGTSIILDIGPEAPIADPEPAYTPVYEYVYEPAPEPVYEPAPEVVYEPAQASTFVPLVGDFPVFYTYFKLVNNAYEPTRQTEEQQQLEGEEIRIERNDSGAICIVLDIGPEGPIPALTPEIVTELTS